MKRRTTLLFVLFVVTAWFYSSMAQNSSEAVVEKHRNQVQMLNEAEERLSGTSETEAEGEQDQG